MKLAALAAIAVALVACGGGGGAATPVAPVAPADGAIVERAPCPVPADHATFIAGLSWLADDIHQAGLQAELAARPLATLYAADELDRLAAAAAEGRCERIVYLSSGLRIAGYLFHAAGAGPHPVVIYTRGGSRDFGKLDGYALLLLQQLAEAGFTVVATQYRGADGGEGADEYGGADVDDVLALVPMARALPGVDGERLYLLGGSRGAMEGLLAIRRGLPVRAAAFRGGLYDATAMLAARPDLATIWTEMIPGFETDRDAVLAARSAITFADEIDVPVLLVHGRQDWRAALSEAETFAAALQAGGTRHKLVIYEREEHQLAFHRAEWIAEVVAWFEASR